MAVPPCSGRRAGAGALGGSPVKISELRERIARARILVESSKTAPIRATNPPPRELAGWFLFVFSSNANAYAWVPTDGTVVVPVGRMGWVVRRGDEAFILARRDDGYVVLADPDAVPVEALATVVV